jgi:hypothetical protein
MLLAAAAPAIAADDGEYQVEMIVFQPVNLPEVAGTSPKELPPADADRVEVTPLAAEKLLLTGAARKMAVAGTHRVLLHLGWRQTATEGHAMHIRSANDVAPPAVEGEASLRVGQRLAFSAELVCRHGEQSALLHANRAVRLGELHYIDHPFCGMLVQVTRVNAPDE